MYNFNLKLSENNKGVLGVIGHVGVGHVHSHSGFVQDDSGGYAVVAALFKKIIEVDTRIKYIQGDPSTDTIVVETYAGGVGQTSVRRGITPMEALLMKKAVDCEGIFTQKTALEVFGRMYGQGALETPVALQGAVALAVMDSFALKAPDGFYMTEQRLPGRIDKAAGIVIDVNNIPVALMLVINGNTGGIGPNEDLEGNIIGEEKGEIMEKIGLKEAPTVVVEGKMYVPPLSIDLDRHTFFIRAQEGVDNTFVATALANAAEKLGYPFRLATDTLPRQKGQLVEATAAFADRVAALCDELKKIDSSQDKVEIIAEMAKLVSEDAGGISFMSNSLHERVGGVGMMPSTSAVISLLTPAHYMGYWKIPVLEPVDIRQYCNIILEALLKMQPGF